MLISVLGGVLCTGSVIVARVKRFLRDLPLERGVKLVKKEKIIVIAQNPLRLQLTNLVRIVVI